MRGAKFVSLSLSAALIAGMVGITGCGYRTDNNNVRTQSLRNKDGRNYDVNSLPQGNRQFSRSAGNGQTERISSLKYSSVLSNKVAQLRDVQTAHVVVTDRDAYVALTRHGSNGVKAKSRMSGMSTGLGANRGPATMNYGGPYGAGYGTRGSGEDGLARGLTGRSGTAGSLFDVTRGNGMTTGRTAGNGMGLDGINGMNGLNGMNGMNDNMMGTNNNRGTGTGTFNGVGMLSNGNTAGRVTNQVPQKLKDEITRTVKKTAPHIRNVHVSEDSDFVTQVGNYATQSHGGATFHGYIADFENMIQRVFPARTGTMTGPNGYAPTLSNGAAGTTRSGVNTQGYSGGVTR